MILLLFCLVFSWFSFRLDGHKTLPALLPTAKEHYKILKQRSGHRLSFNEAKACWLKIFHVQCERQGNVTNLTIRDVMTEIGLTNKFIFGGIWHIGPQWLFLELNLQTFYFYLKLFERRLNYNVDLVIVCSTH